MITTERVQKKLIPLSDEWVTSISLFAATKALNGNHQTLHGILMNKGVSRAELSGVLSNTRDLTAEVAHRVVIANAEYIANVGTTIEPAFIRLSAEAVNSRQDAVHINAEDVLARAAVSRERRNRNGR